MRSRDPSNRGLAPLAPGFMSVLVVARSKAPIKEKRKKPVFGPIHKPIRAREVGTRMNIEQHSGRVDPALLGARCLHSEGHSATISIPWRHPYDG